MINFVDYIDFYFQNLATASVTSISSTYVDFWISLTKCPSGNTRVVVRPFDVAANCLQTLLKLDQTNMEIKIKPTLNADVLNEQKLFNNDE